jgi:cysteine desulfurase / selenocysteine lyase
MQDWRSQFPIFKKQSDLVYLDSASTTQRPQVVLDALDHYYTEMNANVHRGLYDLSEQATVAYEGVRETVQRFINASEKEEIVFTKGTTEGLNIVAQGWGGKFLKEGDEVVLSVMEHHSNIVPWQLMAEKTGAVIRFCPITDEGLLDYEVLKEMMNERTKMVSLIGISNALGSIVDVGRVANIVAKTEAKLCVDAAQLAAHLPIDVQDMMVDFLVFSSHKIYGPTGAGVLWAKRELLEAMDPFLGGGDMIKTVTTEGSTWNDVPWKFEAGTPNIAQVIGMGAAIEFMEEIGWQAIKEHDRELHEVAIEALETLGFVTVIGPKHVDKQRGSISFVVEGVHPHDVSAILGQEGVCVRAGHHCTMPLMKALDVVATTRASFGLYNTKEDVERLIDGLKKVAETFRI